MATLTLTTVTLGTDDVPALVEFYARLLGWPRPTVDPDDATWIAVRDPAGGVGIACQYEEFHRPAVWPGAPDEQQMMSHLEIQVDDLGAALDHAVACGATPAEFQPQADVRVCFDPAGHPFCLWVAD